MDLKNKNDLLNEAAKNTILAVIKLAAYDYIESDRGYLTQSEKQGRGRATGDLIVNGVPVALYVTGSFIQWLITPPPPVVAIGPVHPTVVPIGPMQPVVYHQHSPEIQSLLRSLQGH